MAVSTDKVHEALLLCGSILDGCVCIGKQFINYIRMLQ
jgi:hypothetical protein